MITAKIFFEEFQNKLCASDARYEKIPYYQAYLNCDNYTDLINHYIVPDILKAYGMSVSHEYYRIDVCGWHEEHDNVLKNEFKKTNMIWHSWKLDMFEHENFFRNWNDELNKLLFINCPLKVVVGYNDVDKRYDEIMGDSHKLDLISKVISSLKVEVTGEFMVILGNRGKGLDLSQGIKNYFGYKAYLYDSNLKNFKEI